MYDNYFCHIQISYSQPRYCKLTFDAYRNFALLNLSYSCARLYSNTPAITKDVPKADKPVTGLLNSKTESHIKKALFAVFATLEYNC